MCCAGSYTLWIWFADLPGYRNQWVGYRVCRVQSAGPEGRSLQKWHPTSQPSHYKSGAQPDKISQMLILQEWNSRPRGSTCRHLNPNRIFANVGSHFYRDALAKRWLTVLSPQPFDASSPSSEKPFMNLYDPMNPKIHAIFYSVKWAIYKS